MKTQWINLEDLPQEAQVLLGAFNELFGLHHTNYVVRYATGAPNPIVHVQVYGRLATGSLAALEERCQCSIEVQAIAPNYSLIMMFGANPPTKRPQPSYDNENVNFLFKPIRKKMLDK